MSPSRLAAIGIGLSLVLPAIAFAAGEMSPAQVVQHHMDSFAKHDLDAIMSDYADDAVVMTPNGATQGKAAIRAVFAPMATATGGPGLVGKTPTESGDIGTGEWVQNAGKPNAMAGKDLFLVRHGKILVQTVYFLGPPAAAK